MATIRKRGTKWNAIVDRKGVFKSASFENKESAVAWAASLEKEIVSGAVVSETLSTNKTLGDLLTRYSREVSPDKAGGGKEILRFEMYQRDFPELMKVKLVDLDPEHMDKWKRARLKATSPGTVLREWNTLSNAFKVAIQQWKWMSSNPLKALARPPSPEPRDRIPSEEEVAAILFACGYERDSTPETIGQRVGAAYLFAIETGMRCKEITTLTWGRVNLEDRIVTIPKMQELRTKTGGRDVPLSSEAVRILKQLSVGAPDSQVFGLTEAQVDSNFRKYKGHAMVKGTTFHDAKHLACTRLAKKMPIQDLARMVGTRNLKTLMIYFNPSAKDIAKLLD